MSRLKFKSELIREIRKSDMKPREKRRLINAILWRPDAFQLAMMEMEAAYFESNPDASEIDWENFPWEDAAAFWVAIIKAIGELIGGLIGGAI